MKAFLHNPARVRKALAALVASALLLVAAKALPDVVGVWLTALTPLLTAYGVWKVPNDLPVDGV